MRSDNPPGRSVVPADLTEALYGDLFVKPLAAALLFLPFQPALPDLRIRGEPAIVRNTCAATLYSVGYVLDPDHEASIRFGGKAPRQRAHSPEGIEARFLFGSPPPRIIDGQSGKPTGR